LRQTIDPELRAEAQLFASHGLAVCEFNLVKGHGHADSLMFVNARAVSILEAKKAGEPPRPHERQAECYPKAFVATLTALLIRTKTLSFLFKRDSLRVINIEGLLGNCFEMASCVGGPVR
jgi:hypothetical protein